MTMIDRRRRGRRNQDAASKTYLASLSHELRTPLGGVLGMADLLEGTRLDAEQQAYVAAIRDSGRHLLALVNDVLDLAKIEAGKLELHTAAVEVEDLMRGVVELLSPRAHEKGLEIAWAAQGLDGPVLADAGRLRQILFNLAGNAVKFTPSGGVMLAVESTPSAAGGRRLRFTVSDTGPGVAPEHRARIFEPFAQGPGADGILESTGLGLAVVKRLVRAMDGRLGLETGSGEGARFWFEIHAPSAPASAATLPDLSGLAVAVISPSGVVRDAARLQIEACGGRAEAFITVVAACNARFQGPALVDAACADAGPLPGQPSIILLRPEDRSRINSCRKSGFAGYLIKPLRRVSVATRILAVIGEARPEAAQVEDERAAKPGARGLRVLLAEDDPVNALLAKTLLAREGCDVHHAPTGTSAVEAAASQIFDLILMDRRLPGIDGLEAARRLRAAGVTSPIAALTADAYEEDRRDCLAAGMDAFLPKPLDGEALRGLLARVIGGAFTDDGRTAKLAS